MKQKIGQDVGQKLWHEVEQRIDQDMGVGRRAVGELGYGDKARAGNKAEGESGGKVRD